MNQIRYDSLKEVLPTIKRICTDQQELSFSQGRTYLDHGLILKHKITNFKIKNLVGTFVRKVKQGAVNKHPISFELIQKKSEDEKRLIKLKGWEIQDRLEGFIMFLDIIMTVVTFFLGAFQGFLGDFRKNIDGTTPVLIIKVISIVIFMVRLVLVMITVDYEDDTLYLYITDIVKKQFKGGDIILHIFSLVMVFISLIFPSIEWIGIVFFFSSFFKLALIKSNLKRLELRFVDSIKKFYIWNLVRIVIFDIIFAHIIASSLLAASRINPDSNWITVKLVNNGFVDADQTWYKVYIWTYYWACTIMMTVGFGDITPVDYRESIVVAFIQIFSSIVLAYNISEVGSIVSSMRKSSQQLQRKLGVLRRMAKKNPISQQLQCKIQSYLTHQLQIRDKFEYNEHRAIIDQLPQQLKQEYFYESNRQLYSSIPLFRYFHKNCLSKLNRAFSGKVFYPGEYIIKFRSGNKNIIIMRSGQFGLAFWKKKSSMNGTIVQSVSLQQGQCKGALVTTNILARDTQLNYEIISITYSYGMQLNFQTFLNILKEHKLNYYYYKSVLDRHEKQRSPYDYVPCEYCPQQYHTKFQCPKLHYIPIKSQIYTRHQTTGSVKVGRRRMPYVRQIQKKVKHCYLNRYMLSELQNEIAIFDLDLYQEVQVDQPYDYSLYFKQFNPNNLRNRKFRKPKGLFRTASFSTNSKVIG